MGRKFENRNSCKFSWHQQTEEIYHESIRKLNGPGYTTTEEVNKFEILASHLAHKLTVQNADRKITEIVKLTLSSLKTFKVTSQCFLKDLKSLNTSKAYGPD